MMDPNSNFKFHITLLSACVRKFIFIFKQLRHLADSRSMKMVYLALGRSVLTQ